MNFEITYFFYAALGSVLVGLSKGGLPSTGMLAVPILSLSISPIHATTLLLPIYIISDVVGVWLYRKNFSAFNVKILTQGGLLGVFVGWLTATVISEVLVTFLIGLIGISFCLNSWLRKEKNAEPKQPKTLPGLFWGSLAGFTSFISHAGAPPFQVYVLPQKLSKADFAGTATLVFAVINLAKIWPYQDLRPYQWGDLMDAVYLIPFAIAGTYAGAILTKKIPDKLFFLWVQIGLFLISLKLIWSSFGESFFKRIWMFV
jgi:uncharacterized membrane protein YfcA